LETQEEVAVTLNCVVNEEAERLSQSCEDIGKMLTGLRKAIGRYQEP
jgi:hypothetical protein